MKGEPFQKLRKGENKFLFLSMHFRAETFIIHIEHITLLSQPEEYFAVRENHKNIDNEVC
jgi:hypothetical protein